MGQKNLGFYSIKIIINQIINKSEIKVSLWLRGLKHVCKYSKAFALLYLKAIFQNHKKVENKSICHL